MLPPRGGGRVSTGSLDAVVIVRLLVLLVAAGVLLVSARPVAADPAQIGLWGWPLAGEPTVSRPFDPPPHRYGPGHRGVDLLGAVGDPVFAAGNGVVTFAGWVAGRPVVSIQHADGLRTTYEPVSPSVAAGQVVARGSPIGTLTAGHGGCPVAACLHWGLRRGSGGDAVYLDPLALLRPPRVRLLPWS